MVAPVSDNRTYKNICFYCAFYFRNYWEFLLILILFFLFFFPPHLGFCFRSWWKQNAFCCSKYDLQYDGWFNTDHLSRTSVHCFKQSFKTSLFECSESKYFYFIYFFIFFAICGLISFCSQIMCRINSIHTKMFQILKKYIIHCMKTATVVIVKIVINNI